MAEMNPKYLYGIGGFVLGASFVCFMKGRHCGYGPHMREGFEKNGRKCHGFGPRITAHSSVNAPKPLGPYSPGIKVAYGRWDKGFFQVSG